MKEKSKVTISYIDGTETTFECMGISVGLGVAEFDISKNNFLVVFTDHVRCMDVHTPKGKASIHSINGEEYKH